MWFWLLLLIGIGYLFYAFTVPRTYRRRREDPLKVAHMRLARGEITSEEFEKIRETLENA